MKIYLWWCMLLNTTIGGYGPLQAAYGPSILSKHIGGYYFTSTTINLWPNNKSMAQHVVLKCLKASCPQHYSYPIPGHVGLNKQDLSSRYACHLYKHGIWHGIYRGMLHVLHNISNILTACTTNSAFTRTFTTT